MIELQPPVPFPSFSAIGNNQGYDGWALGSTSHRKFRGDNVLCSRTETQFRVEHTDLATSWGWVRDIHAGQRPRNAQHGSSGQRLFHAAARYLAECELSVSYSCTRFCFAIGETGRICVLSIDISRALVLGYYTGGLLTCF